jgi:hypothetical protein
MSSPPTRRSPDPHPDEQYLDLMRCLAVLYTCFTGAPLHQATIARFAVLFQRLDWFPPPQPGYNNQVGDGLQVFGILLPKLLVYKVRDLNARFLRWYGREHPKKQKPRTRPSLSPQKLEGHKDIDREMSREFADRLEGGFRCSLAEYPVLLDLFDIWVDNAPNTGAYVGWKGRFALKHGHEDSSWATRRMGDLYRRLETHLHANKITRIDKAGEEVPLTNEEFVLGLHFLRPGPVDDADSPPTQEPATRELPTEVPSSDEAHPVVLALRGRILDGISGGADFLAKLDAARTWTELEESWFERQQDEVRDSADPASPPQTPTSVLHATLDQIFPWIEEVVNEHSPRRQR